MLICACPSLSCTSYKLADACRLAILLDRKQNIYRSDCLLSVLDTACFLGSTWRELYALCMNGYTFFEALVLATYCYNSNDCFCDKLQLEASCRQEVSLEVWVRARLSPPTPLPISTVAFHCTKRERLILVSA